MKVSDDIFTAHGREFFDLSPSLFSIVGTDGCFKALSAGWQRTLGWKTAKLLDRPFMDFVHPDDATNTRIVFEKMLADMPVSEHRNRYRCADGTYRWLHWTWTLHLEAELIYTVATDITDAKAAEETRSRLVSEIERRSRQQALLVRLAQRVLEAPVNGETIAFAASVVTQALGVPYGKIFALGNDGLLHLVGGHALPEGVVGSYAAGELDDVHAHRTLAANAPLVVNYARETSVPKSDLAARCGIVTGATVAIGREPVYGVIGAYDTVERDFTADDIAFLEACALTLATAFQARDQETARTEIEIALRDSEAQYRRFFDLNPSPSWIYDVESYRVFEVNERAIELYGYTRAEWLSMSVLDIRPKEDVERLVREVAENFEGIKYWGGWRHLKKDGTSMNVEVHSSCIEWNGRPAHLVVVHDRTAEERAQKVAQKQARELSEVLDGMTNAFVALDRDGRFAYVNGRASQL
ncbi:MAG: PAS domain S-box protein, partial [Vulcanimicrobiaceae bacterium]